MLRELLVPRKNEVVSTVVLRPIKAIIADHCPTAELRDQIEPYWPVELVRIARHIGADSGRLVSYNDVYTEFPKPRRLEGVSFEYGVRLVEVNDQNVINLNIGKGCFISLRRHPTIKLPLNNFWLLNTDRFWNIKLE